MTFSHCVSIVGCNGNSIIEKSDLFKYVDFQKFSMAHLGLHSINWHIIHRIVIMYIAK